MSDLPDKSLSEKELAEIYYWLAQRARERFATRQGIEWKVTWGVWTFFGAGSVAVIAADHWKPAGWAPVAIAAISVLLIKSYSDWMHGFVAEGHKVDRDDGIFWEKRLSAVADPTAVPPSLAEELKIGGDTVQAGKLGEKSRKLCVTITWALAAVLVTVVASAAYQALPASPPQTSTAIPTK